MNSPDPKVGQGLRPALRAALGLIVICCAAVISATAAPVSLSWTDNSFDETGFSVERAPASGGTPTAPFAPIAQVPGRPLFGTVTYVDTTVGSGIEFLYRVQAINIAGRSAYSNTVSNAPTIIAQPAANQTVSAFTSVSFSVVATGSPPPTYQWRRNGTDIPGATSATLTIPSVEVSLHAGTYTVVVSNGLSVISNPSVLTVIPVISRIGGVSVRTTLAANQILIVGLNVAGGEKPILIRAAGPSLGALDVPGTMADPRLTVFSTDTPPVQLAFNDNWAGAPAVIAANTATGAFPFVSAASLDAALVTNVNGGRTVQVSGPAAGNLIVEAYDAGTGMAPRLTGISARNRVGTGTDLLIAGFTVLGPVEKRILIRGVGPSLAVPPFNLTGVLADPKLELFTTATIPALIGENDTYDAALAPVFASVGAFALVPGSRDAAFIANLRPGGYTVQVSGADGGTGLALIEIYELP